MSGIIVCRHPSDEDYRKVVACRFQVHSLIDFCYNFLFTFPSNSRDYLLKYNV